MKGLRQHRTVFYGLLAAAILLAVGGVLMLVQTFADYNELSLRRQDDQLQEMVGAVDEHIAVQLNNLREDLSYMLQRGFARAEADWLAGMGTEDMIFRMEENLVSQNSLVRTLLAIRDGEICLSADGSADYVFPAGLEGPLQPCVAGDGTLYLALLERTEQVEYAVLINVAQWYRQLKAISASDSTRLMLLGARSQLLLHEWRGGEYVSAVHALNGENCDEQAVAYMFRSQNASETLKASYALTDPGEGAVHEMRMMVIPAQESVNGYFTVGLTSDYDEIIRSMHAAAIRLLAYGGIVVLGVLVSLLLMLSMDRHGRRSDRELQRLREMNEEIGKLLEKTQEFAHHQRLETLGTLASSIAHEFNNLLTPIMGYSILTLEGLPPECDELADNVTEIYEASRKAKTIIARLSDLSRKHSEWNFRGLALDEQVRRALEVAAPARPARVHIVTDLTCSRLMSGNETQLSQLLLNLILNAFHAMEETGGILTVSSSEQDGNVVLRVQDEGTGIPPEALPHIFEPFYTTKESSRGTGLGLAIVRQVIESHRGVITVDSVPGEGTVFTIRFPLEAEDESGNINEY